MTDQGQDNGAERRVDGELIEIDLDFASMRRFQAEFSPNLSKEGLFIDTAEPLSPGSVVRFRVILPEEFVFLEGTAVVEWIRTAEEMAEGSPGMALRFVTLSPQNQELVEQLVQDFVGQGGTSFDLDYRPAPGDYPIDEPEPVSDSEPPPPTEGQADEAFLLTIRGTGPSHEEVTAEPLVLPDAGSADRAKEPSSAEAVPLTEDEIDALDQEIDQGFAIVSGPPDETPVPEVRPVEPPSTEESVEPPSTEAPVEPSSAVEKQPRQVPLGLQADLHAEITAAADDDDDDQDAVVGDPPELDWPDELGELGSETIGDTVDAIAQHTGDPDLDALESTQPALDPEQMTGLESAAEPMVSEPAEPEPAEPEPAEAGATEQLAPPSQDPVPRRVALDDPVPTSDVGGVIEPGAKHVVASAMPPILETTDAVDGEPETGVGAGIGSPAFEVSLPEQDDTPDTTPLLPDEGRADVHLETDDNDASGKRWGWGAWLGLAAAIAIVAAGGYFGWPLASEWLASRDVARTDVGEVVEPTSESPGDDPVAADAPAATDEPTTEETAALDGAPAGDGAPTETGQATEPESETEVDQPAPEQSVPLSPATVIRSIDVGIGTDETTVSIRGNGSLESGAVSVSTLPSPPRIIVRVIGITEIFRPYTIDGSTPELHQVRVGHHEERRPPELWVVLDVADQAVVASAVDVRRDTAVIHLSRP
jgi:uncharacterized protein (TIGR02266 family)